MDIGKLLGELLGVKDRSEDKTNRVPVGIVPPDMINEFKRIEWEKALNIVTTEKKIVDLRVKWTEDLGHLGDIDSLDHMLFEGIQSIELDKKIKENELIGRKSLWWEKVENYLKISHDNNYLINDKTGVIYIKGKGRKYVGTIPTSIVGKFKEQRRTTALMQIQADEESKKFEKSMVEQFGSDWVENIEARRLLSRRTFELTEKYNAISIKLHKELESIWNEVYSLLNIDPNGSYHKDETTGAILMHVKDEE